MNNKKIIFRIITLLALVTVGLIFTGCASRKDFTAFTKEYDQTVTGINLKLDISEIEVKKSEGDKIILQYYDTAEGFYDVKEESGVLNVTRTNLGELQENIRFGLGMKKYYKITLSLPVGYTGGIQLETTSGDVTVKGITSENESITIKSDTGDIKVNGVSVSDLNIDGKTSETVLKKLNVSNVSVNTVAGEVLVSDSECAKYDVKGEAADVELKNVSIGQVNVQITTGNVDFINAKVGGSVYVSATTGDVSAEGLDTGTCTVSSKIGDIYLKNLWIGSDLYLVSEDGDITAYVSDSLTGFTLDAVSEYGKNNLQGISGFNGFKNLIARNVTGDINIKFVS